MYDIYYMQTDPDTGRIICEEKIATCESLKIASWVKHSLNKGDHDPNREYLLIEHENLSLDQTIRENGTI